MRLDNKPLERYWMPAPNQDIKKYINFKHLHQFNFFLNHFLAYQAFRDLKKENLKENKNDL